MDHTRRSIVKGMALGALAPFVPTPALAQATDYKAIICLFLFGGNDSMHWVIPYDAAAYGAYAAARGPSINAGGITIPRDQLAATAVMGGQYALHYNMDGIAALMNQGKAAVVANVGPLRRPITKAEYESQNTSRPANLFSHSDQQQLWQIGMPDATTVRTGWGGRIAEKVRALNTNGDLLTALSVNGSPAFVNGDTIRAFPVNTNGNFGIDFYDVSKPDKAAMTQGFSRLVYAPRSRNLFETAWSDVLRGAIQNQSVLQQSLANSPAFAGFPNNGLGNQFKTIAQMIAIRDFLGVKRQVYFASIGGFDLHGDEHYQRNAELYAEIDGAVSAFYNVMNTLGTTNNVVTFTASDFGRTFPVNGRQGSDHGWGANQFVIGGGVLGNRVYGKYPNMVIDGSEDTGLGRWIPNVSVDQMAATLAKWFGLSDADVAASLPNLANFPVKNLGFMG